MKKMNYLNFAWALIAAVSVTGCSDDNKKDDIPFDPVPVETVEAAAGFDISSRIGWNLTVGGVDYDATITKNKITGVPTDKPFCFEKDRLSTYVRLNHPGPFPTQRDEQVIPVYFQTSREKLLMFDDLIGEYKSGATTHISDVKLKHQNVLFEFTLKGLPEDALVSIYRASSMVYPYQNEENPELFQGIVTPVGSINDIGLMIQVGDKRYGKAIDISKAEFVQSRMANKVGDTNSILGFMFTFDAKLEDTADGDDKEITIENIKGYNDGKWSIEEPIN